MPAGRQGSGCSRALTLRGFAAGAPPSEGEGEAPWPPTKLEETLSLDLPGRHPPAFPSLPRQTLE